MQIEIFSDIICPWCAIGKRRFEKALETFDHANEVDVRWRSFELDPSAPAVFEGPDALTRLAEKYNMTREEALASQQQMTQLAAAEGLEFHLDRTKRGNTFDAHRLLHYAYEVGRQDALKERLFRAYFSDGEAIGDRSTLVRLANEVGLEGAKSMEILESDRYGAEVRADEDDARALGVNGVPFFVIERRYGISGAQSPNAIGHVLNEAWNRGLEAKASTPDREASCEGESCPI